MSLSCLSPCPSRNDKNNKQRMKDKKEFIQKNIN